MPSSDPPRALAWCSSANGPSSHVGKNAAATRSPTARRFTPLPISITSPAPSDAGNDPPCPLLRSASDHQVAIVQRYRSHADAHVSGTDIRPGTVNQLQRVEAVFRMELECFHGAIVSSGRLRSASLPITSTCRPPVRRSRTPRAPCCRQMAGTASGSRRRCREQDRSRSTYWRSHPSSDFPHFAAPACQRW